MRAKAFNPQVFLEFLCHSVFAGLMLYLVISKKYLSYVTPRMAPYIYFTAIMMGIWALAGLGRLFRPQHKIRSAHCLVLVIPILMLTLPHDPLRTASLSGNFLSGNVLTGRADQSAYSEVQSIPMQDDSVLSLQDDFAIENTAEISAEPTGDPFAITENDQIDQEEAFIDSADSTGFDTRTGLPEEDYAAPLPGLDVANRKITVSNDDFGKWTSEVYVYPEKYEGYTIVMTGYVLKEPDWFEEDEFVPARLMMTCCAADLAPAGLICKYDKVSELQEESWVTVEGILLTCQIEYEGMEYDDLRVFVTKITEAEEVESFVYPF